MLNISSSIGYGFVSAFVDEDLDTVWLFGSTCNRCAPHGQGCGGESPGGTVQAWSNRKDKTSLMQWDSTPGVVGPHRTYNVEVTRVRSTAQEQQAAGLAVSETVILLALPRRLC